MTLNQLRTFVAVVDCGSVRMAAEQLVVSQPAVSGAVSSLARELGVDLVERDGRGLRVTPAGSAFAAAARSCLHHLDHGVRLARSVEEPGRGAVRIAAIATAAERLLLPILAGFREEYPEAEVTVQVGNRSDVWDALRDYDVDLVVAGRPPSSAQVEVLGQASNTLVVVGLPTERRSRADTMRHLATSTWLLREDGSGTRSATDELLDHLRLDPPRMVLGSNGAVEAAVLAGFGVGLLPLGAVRRRLTSGALARVDCPGTPMDRPWHLVASTVVDLSPTAALAARSLLEATGGFTPAAAGRRLLR
ncbi:MAG: LysR family transcriptional regulator [Acidimicrobiales bacterium]